LFTITFLIHLIFKIKQTHVRVIIGVIEIKRKKT